MKIVHEDRYHIQQHCQNGCDPGYRTKWQYHGKDSCCNFGQFPLGEQQRKEIYILIITG
jgi:hypothetical protein